MENGAEKQEIPEVWKDPKEFFNIDRGERQVYEAAGPTDQVLLPLTRDGHAAMLELAVKQFNPPLPIDDSMSKVFTQYAHHLANETNFTTIETVGKVLYKSLVNALTWTLDQEIKEKQRKQFEEAQRKAKEEFDRLQKDEAMRKREMKQVKKAGRRMTVVEKNESKKG